MYLLRLDDAAEYMNIENWERMEKLLSAYGICPVFGIIPACRDKGFCRLYEKNDGAWQIFERWINKGWTPALHGYEHIYCTRDGGINPYTDGSEFAGLPYDEQKEKVRNGYEILLSHGIKPQIFFAPSHTFDKNTLRALKENTDIRIISDTIATDIYFEDDFYFLPMISSNTRSIPAEFTTFCYHPNTMNDAAFEKLEEFLKSNSDKFIKFDISLLKKRKLSLKDKALRKAYFTVRRFRDIK